MGLAVRALMRDRRKTGALWAGKIRIGVTQPLADLKDGDRAQTRPSVRKFTPPTTRSYAGLLTARDPRKVQSNFTKTQNISARFFKAI
jgi:hypothetical protein